MQFPGNHGGVNWFGTSFNPQLGYLFVNTNELGQLSGLKDHDREGGPGSRRADRATASIPVALMKAFPAAGASASKGPTPSSFRVSSRRGAN